MFLSLGVGDFVGVLLIFSFGNVFFVPVGVSSLLLSLLLLCLLLRLLPLRALSMLASDSDELVDVSTCMLPSVRRTGAAGWLAALAADCLEAVESTVRGVEESA